MAVYCTFNSGSGGVTSGQTFDYYISTSGNDANPGTLASPWAITSLKTVSGNFHLFNGGTGKRIGLLPGTYDVSGLMVNDVVVGALQMPGSASGTNVLACSDSSGHQLARTATLDAKGASGKFGGGNSTGAGVWDGPVISHTGTFPSSYTVGNLTVDGLVFTGFSYKCLMIGANSAGDGPSGITNVVVQNCKFTGGGFNSGDATDNCAACWIDGCTGAIVQNNYFLNNIGHAANSGDHLDAVIVWGQGSPSIDNIIQYNTAINAGAIYGKENNIQGTTVRYNYLDVSAYTAACTGYQDFTGAAASGLTHTTLFYSNIVICQGNTAGGNSMFGWPTLSNSSAWTTPVYCYNNTIICSSSGSGPVVFWSNASGGGNGNVRCYNNIYHTSGTSGSWNGFGNFMCNPSGPQVWDYNLFESTMTWGLYQDAALSTNIAVYTTKAAFATGLSGNGGIANAESHSVVGSPTFAGGTPTFPAQFYKLNGGNGVGTGSSDGTTGGSACDMGAWGGSSPPSRIGCDFT